MNLFEAVSAGTGISSMLFILICQPSMMSPFHIPHAAGKTMAENSSQSCLCLNIIERIYKGIILISLSG